MLVARQTVTMRAKFALLVAALIVSAACAPQVTRLGFAPTSSPQWPASPFPASVTVERIKVRDGGYLAGDKKKLNELINEDGLAQALIEHRVFARSYLEDGNRKSTDLILRGDVVGRWDPRGATNFFVWFPGGIVFAPSWYGTRQQYFTDANIELVDARTGVRQASYQVSTAHQVIHRSSGPGAFFGALIIIPNVIRGARLSQPREIYRDEIYPVAFEELWEEVAAQIAEDRTDVYASAAKAQRERCGSQLDLPPRVGQLWSEFASCQTSYYELESEVQLAEGSAAVFVDTASSSRVSVVDNEIVRYERIPGSNQPRH